MLNIISEQEFNDYSQNNSYKKLASNGTQPKVLESPNGEIIRFFYPKKKYLSSNKYKPYAVRFSNNAKALNLLNIPAPEIKSLQYFPPLKTHILRYEKLAGDDVRAIIKADNQAMISQVIKFIANLHEQGIFFRSIHLGNVIIQPNGKLGLIDIADTRFTNNPLGMLKRYRNLKHIIYNRDDHHLWKQFGIKRFLEIYFENSQCTSLTKMVLMKGLA